MKEIWKSIIGFEDLYEVSNLGRIKSLIQCPSLIRSTKNKKGDYLRISLSKNGKTTTVLIHRVVWEAFNGDISKGYQVHHIDGNKQNNRLSNLLSISIKYHNSITLKENPTLYKNMVRMNISKSKAIVQYNINGEFIAEYFSIKEASLKTGICKRNIYQVASGEPYKDDKVRKSAGGYLWRYKQ